MIGIKSLLIGVALGLGIASAPQPYKSEPLTADDHTITEQTHLAYEQAYGEPMEDGWTTQWVGAVTFNSYKEIFVCDNDLTKPDARRTLAHEMVHVRHWDWAHGRQFDKEVDRIVKRIDWSKVLAWEEPKP